MLRRHRLIELFLVEVLGMDWSEVHEEAEELEHAVSDPLIDRIDAMLGHPPSIPTATRSRPPAARSTAAAAAQPGGLRHRPADARVARVLDQDPGFLQLVEREGLKPGRPLEVLSRDPAADTVVVRRAGGDLLSLGFRAASKIEVEVMAAATGGLVGRAG